jgi:hypothetical protein
MLGLSLLFVSHFVADFIFQSRKMGKEKSEKYEVLLHHLAIIAVGSVPAALYCFNYIDQSFGKYVFFNTLIHGIIDWNIWKLYKYKAYKDILASVRSYETSEGLIGEKSVESGIENYKFWDDHWFYVTIGFDQLLHGLTIIILYGVLS